MKRMTLLATALLLGTTMSTQAQEVNIITPSQAPPQVQLKLKSDYDFEQSQTFSLKVQRDVSLLPSDKVIAMIEALDFRDGAGVNIRSGWDFDQQHNLVIGFSGGSAEIIKAQQTPHGIQIIASFKDAQGNFVAPPVSQIGLMNAYGDPLCFDYQDTAQQVEPVKFVILLDRSGSMEDYLPQVQSAARNLLNLLPDRHACLVGSFSDNLLWHGGSYGMPSCNPQNFNIRHLETYGGTNLYGALQHAYSRLRHLSGQKAVIVITDGVISDNHDSSEQTLAALMNDSRDTLTFTYWLGERNYRYLYKLANSYFDETTNIQRGLERYLGKIAGAYAAQRVLTVKECRHATP